ncbi:MAG: FkbM family methyltransferase [Chthoniobacterales bacterium]
MVDYYQQLRSLIDTRYRRAYRSFRNLPKIQYRTLVDAGASHAIFTDAFSALHRPSRIVLVEAIPELAEALRRRFARRPGISVVAAALAAASGEADFEVNRSLPSSSLLKIAPRNPDWSSLDLQVARTVRVRTVTLGQLLLEEGLDSVDLLKLDLQGAERLVLTGSEETLPRIRVIYTEVFFERLYEEAWLFWEMNEYLTGRGFKLCGISNISHGRIGDLLHANAVFRQREL